MSQIEVIFTFHGHDQEMATFTVAKELTEKQFLTLIFDNFENHELDLLDSLVKLSCCQIENNLKNVYSYILKSNGKYYFNPDVNKDADVMASREFLNDYIKGRKEKIING